MAIFEEHLALYGQLRATVLARHFALGRFNRANLLSLNNLLDLPPPGMPASVAPWCVASHERENPLLYGALLQTTLAVEHHLGSPSAAHILQRNLTAIESLVCLQGEHAGWLTRWDAATSDNWTITEQGERTRCEDFLLDAAGNYQRCNATADARHIAWRGVGLRQALHNHRDAQSILPAEDNGLHWQHVNHRRTWEPSMDELSGLFGGWAIADALVPAARGLIRPAASVVARRLAAHGYTLIRPCGGFAARGSTGMLAAFELPIDGWMRHIGGGGAAASTDFRGALALAGYQPVLQKCLDESLATVILSFPAVVSALGLALPVLGPLGGTAGWLLNAVVKKLGPATLALVLAVNNSADLFDPHLARYRGEPVLAALMSSLSPRERLDLYFDLLAVKVGDSAGNFPPFLALMAHGDDSAEVRAPYLSMIRVRRRNASTDLVGSGLDSAFATAVAVLLGADDLAPTLAAELEARYQRLAGNGGDVRSVAVDAIGDEAAKIGAEFLLVLDYLGAMALAWLHDAAAPTRCMLSQTPSPSQLAGLPEPAVPTLALEHLPEVRAVVMGAAPLPAESSVPLFSGGADRDKEMVCSAVLPPRPQNLAAEFSFELGHWTGDLPTGVMLQDGDDYEISVSGVVSGWSAAGGAPVTDPAWPLHVALDPRAAQGCVLGRLDDYFYIGTGLARRPYLAWHHRQVQLYLRINRPDRRRRPEEAFVVTVRVWGPKRPMVFTGRFVDCVERAYGEGKRKRKKLITAIGGSDPQGRRWRMDAGVAAGLIDECGQIFRVHGPGGARLASVHGKYGTYLRSAPDSQTGNNLSELRCCPLPE